MCSPTATNRIGTFPSREDINLFSYPNQLILSSQPSWQTIYLLILVSFYYKLPLGSSSSCMAQLLQYYIHNHNKTIRIIPTAKSTLLNLVDKYILEANMLPKHKRLFFVCKKLKYQTWNITELQNWLSSARKILRRYRDRIVVAPINTTSNLPSKYIVHCPPNNNHYTSSPITKYYTKHNSYMILTSTNPTLQNISNPTNTIVSKLPSVRNPSPYSIKYYIPRVPFLKQLPTTNSIPNETNHDNINKNLVSELKQNKTKHNKMTQKIIKQNKTKQNKITQNNTQQHSHKIAQNNTV